METYYFILVIVIAMGGECCDNDLLGSGRCNTCPYLSECIENNKKEIEETLEDNKGRDKGESL